MSSRIGGVRDEMQISTCGVWRLGSFDNGMRRSRTMKTTTRGCRQVVTAYMREVGVLFEMKDRGGLWDFQGRNAMSGMIAFPMHKVGRPREPTGTPSAAGQCR